MKAKYLIIVVLFILAYIISTELIFHNRKRLLNESNVQGIIEDLYSSRDGIKFRIKHDSKSYRFYPKPCGNFGKDFYDIANVGDSIYKPTYSDTLKLIKKNKVYLYTFKKND